MTGVEKQPLWIGVITLAFTVATVLAMKKEADMSRDLPLAPKPDPDVEERQQIEHLPPPMVAMHDRFYLLVDRKLAGTLTDREREELATLERQYDECEVWLRQFMQEYRDEIDQLRASAQHAATLALFKKNTHTLLDGAGVPQFENEDCRVSHRIRWLGERAEHAATLEHLAKVVIDAWDNGGDASTVAGAVHALAAALASTPAGGTEGR